MNHAMIDGITNIDEDLIEKYFKLKAKYAKKSPRNTRHIVKWSSIAASIGLLFIAGFMLGDYFQMLEQCTQTMESLEQIAYLVDECLAGRKLTYMVIDDEKVLAEVEEIE